MTGHWPVEGEMSPTCLSLMTEACGSYFCHWSRKRAGQTLQVWFKYASRHPGDILAWSCQNESWIWFSMLSFGSTFWFLYIKNGVAYVAILACGIYIFGYATITFPKLRFCILPLGLVQQSIISSSDQYVVLARVLVCTLDISWDCSPFTFKIISD